MDYTDKVRTDAGDVTYYIGLTPQTSGEAMAAHQDRLEMSAAAFTYPRCEADTPASALKGSATMTTDREPTTWELIVKAGLEASTFGQLDLETFKAALHIDPLNVAANKAADDFVKAVNELGDAVAFLRDAEAKLETRGTPEPLEQFEGFGHVA